MADWGLVPSSQREDLMENQCFELLYKELRLAYESKLLGSIRDGGGGGGDGFGGVLGVLFGGATAQSRAGSRAGFMNAPGGRNGQGGGRPVSDSHGGLVDASLAAAEEIGDIFKQLISFVETNAASFVLERPFTNRLINMPPESVSSMQGASPIFYHDLQMSFVRTLWYGVEMQLFIFDVLVFCAVDKALDSFALAAFITWIVGACVDHARAAFGSANISRKSLIDERFLI